MSETPVTKKAPNDFAAMAESCGGKVPTQEQFDEFVSLKMREYGAGTFEGLKRVAHKELFLENQLVIRGDGKYKTYGNEYKYLIANFQIWDLTSRKVLC